MELIVVASTGWVAAAEGNALCDSRSSLSTGELVYADVQRAAAGGAPGRYQLDPVQRGAARGVGGWGRCPALLARVSLPRIESSSNRGCFLALESEVLVTNTALLPLNRNF